MTRNKQLTSFRTALEVLESRDLMAADASAVRVASFLASANNNSTTQATQSPSGSSTSTTNHVIAPVAPAPTPPIPAPTPAPTPAAQADWFSSNLHDTALQSLVRADAADAVLSRTDMLAIFAQVEKDGTVSATEFTDLKQVVGHSSFFSTDNYVAVLAGDVVNGNVANSTFQGHTLGNLAASAKSTQLVQLVDKWFLGQDHPTAMSGLTYKLAAANNLFPQHDPTYADIVQGQVGDCYLLSTLAETAIKNPNAIKSMFTANGDNTYTVRFFHNGVADYVTVDSMLPTTSGGMVMYAGMGQSISNKSMPLWVALAEKAYVQMNQSGWLRADLGDLGGHNSYDSISGGYMIDALNQVDNKSTAFSAVDQNTFVAAFNAGSLITFGTNAVPADRSIVGNHAYAVVGYNAATGQLTLFNPWGVNQHNAPGLVTMTIAQMKNDFNVMEYTT